MKKLPLSIIALAVALGLVAGLAGCCGIVKSCLQQVLILGQPQGQTVITNTDATLSVYALAGPPFANSGLTYQWQFNGIQIEMTNLDYNWSNIPGATSNSITISSVQLTNVGYYRVLVSAPGSSTVTSDAAALQAITAGSFDVYGTPIAGSDGHYCSGSFAGYIPYTNFWAVASTNLAITAKDAVPTAGSQVGYLGWWGDPGCGSSGSVSKSPPFVPPFGSPKYQFTLYFSGSIPSSPRPYPLQLTNLQ
jgi:hypothetical protein